jgi:hypothetical protein
MARTLITKKELKDWLTAEIQKEDDCQTCEFRGVMGLQEPDEDGCNWSDTLYLNQSGIPSSIVRKVVVAARAKFNISD